MLRGLVFCILIASCFHVGESQAQTPAPSFNVDFVFADDVSAEDEWLIREGVRFAWQYVDDTLGTRVRGRPIVEVGLDPNPFASAYAGNDRIVISPGHRVWLDSSPLNRLKIIVHEYVHLVQYDLIRQTFDPGPIWLMEGSAELIAFQAVSSLGLLEFGAAQDRWITHGLNGPLGWVPLEDMASGSASPDILCCMYEIVPIAVEKLVAEKGVQSLVDYYSLIGFEAYWQDAFPLAFGQTVEDFYLSFAATREELAPAGFDQGAIAYPSFASGGSGDFTVEALPESIAGGTQALLMGLTAAGAYCSLQVAGLAGNILVSQGTYAGIDGKVFWLWTPPPDMEAQAVAVEIDCGGTPAGFELSLT
jgi:hypothetical protein